MANNCFILILAWIHRPLQASLCELRPDKSLEAQSSRRKFIFPRAGDDARQKGPGRCAAKAYVLQPAGLECFYPLAVSRADKIKITP